VYGGGSAEISCSIAHAADRHPGVEQEHGSLLTSYLYFFYCMGIRTYALLIYLHQILIMMNWYPLLNGFCLTSEKGAKYQFSGLSIALF